MVEGVTKGYEKRLTIVGVGYRAAMKGSDLEVQVGYSHPVLVPAPEGIEFEAPTATSIVVRGNDKQQVGEVAANIRKIRKPEPYKGKGIRYENEYVRKKAGKAAKGLAIERSPHSSIKNSTPRTTATPMIPPLVSASVLNVGRAASRNIGHSPHRRTPDRSADCAVGTRGR